MIDQRALELAYRYLSRRERTVSEVRHHLAARDLDEPSITAAIEVLIEQGYLDDARFVRMFVQDKRELEQWGEGRIRQGLLARGVNRELVDSTLSDGELERAVELLRRRFADFPDDQRDRRRALGMLLRKGYDYELACDALRLHLDTA